MLIGDHSDTLKSVIVLLLSFIFLANEGVAGTKPGKAGEERYREIEWIDLMPSDDLDALMNPPESLDSVTDGSAEDELDDRLQGDIAPTGDSRYDQALVSTRVVPEFDGQVVRIPGFVVPLAFNEQQQVTRFFLVPFFGACIHVPPPPPNQIIYAQYEKGFKLPSLYQPFWIAGSLSTAITENDTAKAAYTIKVDWMEPYTE